MQVNFSVADPGCLSRILIFTHPGPGSRIPIPDLGSRIQKQPQKRGVKKNLCHGTFFYSHKFHNIVNYFIFEMLKKKKIWANFQRIIELFTQKIVTMLSKIWVWYPGSGIRKKPIPDPTRGQKGTGSRIRNTGKFTSVFKDH
jgi:hypothetical protein